MVIGSGGQALVSFVANLLLARMLVPEDFGTVALVLANIGLASALLSPRLSILILRAPRTPEGDACANSHLRTSGTLSAIIFVVGLVALRVAGTLDLLSASIAGAVCLNFYLNHYFSNFERSQRFGAVASARFLQLVFVNLAALALAWTGAGVVALGLREVLRPVALGVWLRAVGALSVPRPLLPSRKEAFASIRDARYLWTDGWLEMGMEHGIVLLVGAFGGVAGAGHFTLAYRLAKMPNQLFQPLVARLPLAWLAGVEDPRRRARIQRKITMALLAVLVPGALLCFVLARPIVVLVYGDQWELAGRLLSGLSGVVVALSLTNLAKTGIYASSSHGKLWVFRLAQVVSLVAALGGLIQGGLEPLPALAASLSISYLATAVVGFWAAKGLSAAPT